MWISFWGAGHVRQVSGDTLAFLFDQGEGIALNSLLPAGSGWSLTDAEGINDSGVIVGAGYHNGELRAYSFSVPSTPASGVPLPSALLLLDAGMVRLVAYGRRKRVASS
jgi:hypothetical protein